MSDHELWLAYIDRAIKFHELQGVDPQQIIETARSFRSAVYDAEPIPAGQ